MSRWLMIALILVSCRTATPQHQTIESTPNSGAVSAKLISDPNAPEAHLAPGEEFTAPRLVPGNPSPVYPATLLALNLPAHTVAVRVTFNDRGELAQIAPSPVAASTDDQYRPLFEGAVRDALSRWRCWPPRVRKFRPGPDADGDGKPDYRILVDERIFSTFFDVAFSFEIVQGKPVVNRAQ